MLILSLVIWMVATRGVAKPGDLAPTRKAEADDLSRSLAATVVPGATGGPAPASPPAAEKAASRPIELAAAEALGPESEPSRCRKPKITGPAGSGPRRVGASRRLGKRQRVAHHRHRSGRSSRRTLPQPKPLLSRPREQRFDTSLLKGNPVHHTVSLDKLLAAPRSYLNQIVVLAGLFQVARSQHDRTDGTRKCSVTEWKFEPGRTGGPPLMSPSLSTEMDVEPKLAECLDGLDPGQREGKGVSILTLWVPSSGVCCLVKIEILQKTAYGVKRGFKHQPDIEYETLSVTSEGAKIAKGMTSSGRRSAGCTCSRNSTRTGSMA